MLLQRTNMKISVISDINSNTRGMANWTQTNIDAQILGERDSATSSEL